MPDPLPWIAQVVIALTFVWAATAKLVRWGSWTGGLARYAVPPRLVTPVGLAVPVLELVVAALILGGATEVAMASSIALLSVFSLAVVRARTRTGNRVPCGCFGGSEERDFRLILARNAVLAALAGAVLVSGFEEGLISSSAAPRLEETVPAILVGAGIGLLVWMLRHAGSLMRRKEHM